jgi:type IV pilus assembly protein PilV
MRQKNINAESYFNKQSGATLIEVAITVLILATSLLAMATLQTRSLQFNQSAFMRSQANILAYDIMDRMRLNRGTDGDNRLTAYTADYDDEPAGNAVATADVSAWREAIEKQLPEGEGKIDCVQATRICTISIRWKDSSLFDEDNDDEDLAAEAVSEFEFTSVI